MKAKDIADRAALLLPYFLKFFHEETMEVCRETAVYSAIQLELEAEKQIKARAEKEQNKNKAAFDAQRKAFELYKKEKLAKREPPPTLPDFVKNDFDFGPQEG